MNFDSILRNNMLNELFMAEYEEVVEIVKNYKALMADKNIKEFENEYFKINTDYNESLNKLDAYVEEPNCTIDETKSFKIVELQSRTKNALVNLIKKFFSKEDYIKNVQDPIKFEHKTSKQITAYDLYVELCIIRNHLAPFLSVIGYYARRNYFLNTRIMTEIDDKYNEAIRKINSFFNSSIENKRVDLFYRPSALNGKNTKGFIDMDEKSIINLIHPYFVKNIPEVYHIAEIVYQWVIGKALWSNTQGEMSKAEKDKAYLKELYTRVGNYVERCIADGVL